MLYFYTNGGRVNKLCAASDLKWQASVGSGFRVTKQLLRRCDFIGSKSLDRLKERCCTVSGVHSNPRTDISLYDVPRSW